jgi:septum formation topological specificity factor MinE
MKSKSAEEMKKRLGDMLTRDKVGVNEGFMTALDNDVNKLLNDYFELDKKCGIKVSQGENGKYILTLSASASRIKSFLSTADIKRG